MTHTTSLTYFDGAGRAEPIRIALFLAGIPFEDKRVSFPEFMALKQSGALPLGSLPVLEHEGRTIAQSVAILRYLGRLAGKGLYPESPEAGLLVDSALDTFNDTLSHALHPSMFERDAEKKLAMRREFIAGPMATCCGYVESLIKGPLLVGETLTIADLVIGGSVEFYLSGKLDGVGSDALSAYPRLLALAEAYRAHPDVVAYYAQLA